MGECLEERLIIEVDGSQHLERALLDARRDARVEPSRDDYLESLGFRVLRFWDNQVLNETDAIIEVIAQVLEKREEGPPSLRQAQDRPDLPPRTGEGNYLALPDPPVSMCLDNEKTLVGLPEPCLTTCQDLLYKHC